MVLVLWALLPTPFVGEAEAANPLLESLVAKVDALQADVDSLAEAVAALAGDDLAGQLGDHHDAVVAKLGELADQFADHDDALAAEAGALADQLSSHDDKLDDLIENDEDGVTCCSWSKSLSDSARWEDVLPYFVEGSGGQVLVKYGAVLDRETGLVWIRSPIVVGNYEDAQEVAIEYTAPDGTCGWRLPTADEFATLLHKDGDYHYLPESGPFSWSFDDDAWLVWTSTRMPEDDAAGAQRRFLWYWTAEVGGYPADSWKLTRASINESNHIAVWLVRGPGGLQH